MTRNLKTLRPGHSGDGPHRKSRRKVGRSHLSKIEVPTKDTFSNFLMFEHMPEVIKANIEVTCDQPEKFIGSLPSIQRLSLCSLTSKVMTRNLKTRDPVIPVTDLTGKVAKSWRSHLSKIEVPTKDTFSNFLMFEHMPEVIKANIEVTCDQPEKFIGSLPSIQRLSLCSLTSKTPYPRGSFFFYLEHLEICTCSAGWWNLLNCILQDAPRLQSLKLKLKHDIVHYSVPMNFWREPTVFPDCLSKHLEILEWRGYEGTEQDSSVAKYILANATCLKMATLSTRCRNKKRRMLRKLKSLGRVSKTCQLVFD